MPYKLVTPLEKTFILEETDRTFGNDGTPTTVTIRQATQREHDLRETANTEFIRRQNENTGGIEFASKFTYGDTIKMEVYSTMTDCNILDENGDPLFKFRKQGNRQILDMTTRQFVEAWGKLDPIVASEIHSKVLEVNVSWAGPLA